MKSRNSDDFIQLQHFSKDKADNSHKGNTSVDFGTRASAIFASVGDILTFIAQRYENIDQNKSIRINWEFYSLLAQWRKFGATFKTFFRREVCCKLFSLNSAFPMFRITRAVENRSLCGSKKSFLSGIRIES